MSKEQETVEYIHEVDSEFARLRMDYKNARDSNNKRDMAVAMINLVGFLATFKTINAICFQSEQKEFYEKYKKATDYAINEVLSKL